MQSTKQINTGQFEQSNKIASQRGFEFWRDENRLIFIIQKKYILKEIKFTKIKEYVKFL
jgi:hypothetical protein